MVVKVGSSSLTQPSGHLDVKKLNSLVAALSAASAQGARVVLVSSGAIAAGFGPLGFESRPSDVATQQAVAAVGRIDRARTDAVGTHDAVRYLVQRNAEQDILDHVVLDQQIVALGHQAAVERIVRIAATAQGQAAQGHVVGPDGEDGALAAGIDDHLAAAVESQWPGNDRRPRVGSRWQADPGTR